MPPLLPAPRMAARLGQIVMAGLLLSSIQADVVHLKSGNRVEGEVSPGSRPGYIRVILDKGLEIEFREKDVIQIEKKKSPAKEFEERFAAVPAGDIDALYDLAQWARERKLRSREEEIYKRILEIDPNDPLARRELGFVVFKNRWVKEEDLKKQHGLIQFRGDWVTPEEKERRILEEIKKEITDLMRDVDSENRYIQEYSIRKLLEYRDPRARAVVLNFLGDDREAVRVVAIQMLAELERSHRKEVEKKSRNWGRKSKGTRGLAKLADPANGPGEDEIARALLERVIQEESRTVRMSLANALHKIQSRGFFDIALETLHSSPNALHRDRAAEGILFALRKAWVSDLIAALPRRPPWASSTSKGNPQIKSILVRISRQDFGYQRKAWEGWWELNQNRYVDGD